jgi:hypothetical protein
MIRYAKSEWRARSTRPKKSSCIRIAIRPRANNLIAVLIAAVSCLRANANSDVVVFDHVKVASSEVESSWTLVNDFGTTITLTYSFAAPTPPFSVENGSLNGSVPAGLNTSVTFGFTPPATMLDVTTNLAQTLNGTVTKTDSQNPGNPTVIPWSISLVANLYGATPVNFRKNPDGLNGNSIVVTVAWDSSTGDIDDLDGMSVKEMLVQPEPRLFDISRGTGNIPDFPQCGKSLPFFFWTNPPPWQPLGPDGKPYGTPRLQSMDPIERTGQSQYFVDSYGDNSNLLRKPLQQGTITIQQVYWWTAAYLQDQQGCHIWKPLLTAVPGYDLITVAIIPQNGRWVSVVSSAQANYSHTFDQAGVTASLSTAKSVTVSWPLIGSTLQVASFPGGPWADVPESTNSTHLDLPATQGSQFFRVRP